VDELFAERNLQLEQLVRAAVAVQARHGAEAVEVARAARACVVVDRVTAAKQPRHHGLGDAGGEARGDCGIRRGSAGLEDLHSCLGRGRMASCDGRSEHPLLP
jgi:hypothetical protein